MYPRLNAVGLQVDRAVLVSTANGSRVWLHDKQPSQSIQPSQAYDLGSVFIRMLGVAALLTNEKASRLSVRPLGVPALTALLAGILRVNEGSEDAAPPGFVDNEARKLRKGPAVQPVALSFSGPGPFANALEIFQGKPAPGAFSQRYYGFKN